MILSDILRDSNYKLTQFSQEQIAALVEESFKLKAESERLLEVAKKPLT